MGKKTEKQNTNPLRPCAHRDAPHPGAGPDQPHPPATPAAAPPAGELHPGIRLLLDIAASRPELLLTGKALTDQGRVITVMLEAGWSTEQLRHVITGRPLPTPVRTSVGAIIAARLRAAQAYPPPATAAGHHTTSQPPDPAPGQHAAERSSAAAAARTVTEALTYGALVECTGCGVPGPLRASWLACSPRRQETVATCRLRPARSCRRSSPPASRHNPMQKVDILDEKLDLAYTSARSGEWILQFSIRASFETDGVRGTHCAR